MQWIGTVECDYGGPVVLADVPDFMKWNGAAPYPLERRRTLHYFGQFTPELPAPYGSPEAGHQWRQHASFEALAEDREALLSAIRSRFGDVDVAEDAPGETRVRLADGRSMTIALAPQSAYDEACSGSGSLWSHPLGADGRAQALFWDKEGPGAFSVGLAETRDDLLLLRTWASNAGGADALRRHASHMTRGRPTASLEVGDAGVVVAYAPIGWLETLEPSTLDHLLDEHAAGRVSLEETQGRIREAFRSTIAAADPIVSLCAPRAPNCGAALALASGTYAVMSGHTEVDGAGAYAWCRLQRSAGG